MTIRIARLLHRLALRLAPKRVRQVHGDDMQATFDAMCERAARQGTTAVWRLVGREMADMLRARGLARKFKRESNLKVGPILQSSATSPLHELLDSRGWRQSLRSLARRPAFAVVAILTLALGASMTTVVFSVVDTVLLSPLPYPDSGQLVTLYEASPSERGRTSLVAPGRLDDWQRLNTTFVAMTGSYGENVTDTSGPEPERLEGRRVAPRFFEVYGAAPIVGRVFTDEEQKYGGPLSVVISEGFWTRRFARDPKVVNRQLSLAGTGYAIVGVMPRTFSGPTTDVWLPAQTPSQILAMREARFLNGVGRMKPGVTIEQARADLLRVQRSLGEQFPATDKNWSVELQDLKQYRTAGQSQRLWLIFGAVGLLWLIGVTNLAGLMLVQMRRRHHDIAVRAAIGASRFQIVATIVREMLVLGLIGGTLAVLFCSWLITLVASTFPTLPRTSELGFNGHALAWAFGSTMLAAMMCGWWPAMRASRRSIAHAGHGTRSTARRHRMQQSLVAAQVALSVMLVGSAILLARTYINLATSDAGFNANGVITFHVGAGWSEDRPRIGQSQVRLIEELERLPGVEAAGFTNFLPMTGATLRYLFTVEGVSGPERDGGMTTGTRMISSDYLRSIGVPVVSGTTCPPLRMDFDAPQYALVNARFVETFASGQNLVGRTIKYVQNRGQTNYTIVGVAGDVVEDGPGAPIVPYVYTCQSAGSWPDPEYVVRGRDRVALVPAIRQLVRKLEPDRPLFGLKTLDAVIDLTLDEPRLSATMLSVFAVSALALASLGLYSVFMLLVAESTREIGVRLALGAAPGQVRRQIFFGAGRLCLAGVIVGMILSAATQRFLGSLLFGVKPLDPITLAATALTLCFASAIAIALPAMRAGRIDPIVVLKM